MNGKTALKIGLTFSVGRQLSLLLVAVVVLFLTMAIYIYHNLSRTEQFLSELGQNTIPSVVDSSSSVTQTNQLFNALEQLTRATTPAARRIAEAEVKKQLMRSQQLAMMFENNEALSNHLLVIRADLSELSNLIETELNLRSDTGKLIKQIHQLQSRFYSQLSTISVASSTLNNWNRHFSELVIFANSAYSNNRLSEIRELTRRAKQSLIQLQSLNTQLPSQLQQLGEQLTGQLSRLLFQNDGLFEKQIQLLKISGRTRGREHFVSNMINDYTRMTSKLSYYQNQRALAQIQDLNQDINRQTRWFKLVGLIIIVTLIAIALIVHLRIVKRLRNLTDDIHNQLSQEDAQKLDSRLDEIDELSQTLQIFSDTIQRQTERLQTLSMTDSLTGIANRRAFDTRIMSEMNMVIRQRWNMSVLLIDVDYFKLYNDNYGHAAGDKTLQKTADILQSCLRRDQDFVGRYGGEEFVCILPDTDSFGAKQVANAILNAARDAAIPHCASKVHDHLTFSIGILTHRYGDEQTSDEIMRKVDTALYYSKENGRARFTHIDDVVHLYDM